MFGPWRPGFGDSPFLDIRCDNRETRDTYRAIPNMQEHNHPESALKPDLHYPASCSSEDPAALLEVFQNSAPDYAFITLNSSQKIEAWSLGAERIFGYCKDEALGADLKLLFTEEDQANGVVDHEFSVARRESRADDERWLERKDSTRFWASGVLTKLCGAAGQEIGFCKIVRDLTERKLLEDQLAASVQEKEFLLREIHHRVKNNLQVINNLISMQAEITDHPGVREIFSELQDRIRTIVTLHETLYTSPEIGTVLLGPYIGQLVKTLFAFHANHSRHIGLHFEAADIAIDIEQALPLGLIFNELITNCFKHGFPGNRDGAITVSLRYLRPAPGISLDDADCELSVSDNGAGIKPVQGLTELPSMGLRIVRALAKELHGTVEVARREGPGTTFAIRFPLKRELPVPACPNAPSMIEQPKTRYQGRELLFLLIAMLVPAGMLYLSFVLAIAAGKSGPNHQTYVRLSALSTIALAVFVPVQLAGARYLQRLLPSRTSAKGKVVQYIVALATGLLFSVCAAMVLVALGLNVLARMRA